MQAKPNSIIKYLFIVVILLIKYNLGRTKPVPNYLLNITNNKTFTIEPMI